MGRYSERFNISGGFKAFPTTWGALIGSGNSGIILVA